MKTKNLIGYIGLGIISALIIVVVLLSVIPVKGKYSPNIDRPTSQISVSKSSTTGVKLFATDTTDYAEERQKYFNKTLDTFNGLGNFTVMQSLFLGLSSVDTSIKKLESNKHLSTLQSQEGYLYVFEWNESQTLKNVDGSEYIDPSTESSVEFKKLAVVVDNKNQVAEYSVYIFQGSSTYAKYAYTSYANVKALYDLAAEMQEKGGSIGWSGS